MLTAIAKARAWINDRVEGRVASFAEIAEREGKVERHIGLLALQIWGSGVRNLFGRANYHLKSISSRGRFFARQTAQQIGRLYVAFFGHLLCVRARNLAMPN